MVILMLGVTAFGFFVIKARLYIHSAFWISPEFYFNVGVLAPPIIFIDGAPNGNLHTQTF